MIHGTDVTVEIAFGSGPLDDSPAWTDVSTDWRYISFTRGRSYELDRMQAGTATVVLNNRHGNYNQHNTLGDYYPDVRPMVPIRITATRTAVTYPLWQGFVERWPVSFPGNVDAVVSLECVDLFKLLNLAGRSAANRSQVVDSLNPVAWYRLADETDEVGSNDLIFAGSPVEGGEDGPWTGDVATAFDGTNDTGTFTTESDIARQNTDRSYEVWFLIDPSAGTDVLLRIAGVVPYTAIVTNPTTLLIGGEGHGSPASVTPEVGWNHVVISDNFGASTRTFYLNGENVGGGSLSVESGTADAHLGSNAGATFFQGSISEFVVYPTALTAQQVQALYAAQFEAFPVERTDERIAAFLLDYGYPTSDLEEGQTNMSGINSPEPSSILEGIQTAADTEFGQFFIAADGTPTFHDRHFRLIENAASISTFDGTEYIVALPSTDDQLIANDVRITTSDGADPFIATDGPRTDPATSQGMYGPRTLDRTIYPDDQNEGYDFAHYLLSLYKDPSTRIPAISFRLGDDSNLWAVILAGELGDKYTIQLPLEGDDLDQDVYLEAITHSISSQTKVWDVTWQLSPATDQTFWALGVAGLSELGETTVLAY